MLARTGLTKTVQFYLERDGKFPQRRVISPRVVAWIEDEIDAWIASRPIAGKIEEAS